MIINLMFLGIIALIILRLITSIKDDLPISNYIVISIILAIVLLVYLRVIMPLLGEYIWGNEILSIKLIKSVFDILSVDS